MTRGIGIRFLQGSGGTGEGFEVVKYGDGRVALIGAPKISNIKIRNTS